MKMERNITHFPNLYFRMSCRHAVGVMIFSMKAYMMNVQLHQSKYKQCFRIELSDMRVGYAVFDEYRTEC